MKINRSIPAKSTIRLAVGAALLTVLTVGVMSVAPAYADVVVAPTPAANPQTQGTACNPKTDYCTPFRDGKDPAAQAQDSDKGNKIIAKYISPAVAALSALAGIAVAGSVIFAGIQYITSGGDSSKVAAAKQRILKAIFILITYIFFYAAMRWLMPGSGL